MTRLGELKYREVIERLQSTAYKVLCKYLNHNPVICEQFDKSKFRDLCKKQ